MKNTNTPLPKPLEQPPDTPKAVDIPARAMPGRKIDASTIAEMARLCAKTLTESEACRRLGIKPRTWFDFKSRCGRTQQFADMVEAFRAARIEHLIARIEKSADGMDGAKYPDWRAALALLKITDAKRFSDSPAVEINAGNQTAITVQLGGEERLRQLVEKYHKQGTVQLATVAPKQLADAKPEE